jgi:hypothetical protein
MSHRTHWRHPRISILRPAHNYHNHRTTHNIHYKRVFRTWLVEEVVIFGHKPRMILYQDSLNARIGQLSGGEGSGVRRNLEEIEVVVVGYAG